MNLSDSAILNIKSCVYLCIISLISKYVAINLMQNVDLIEKITTLYSLNNLFSYIKLGKEILMFDNIEIGKNKFYHYKTPIFWEM